MVKNVCIQLPNDSTFQVSQINADGMQDNGDRSRGPFVPRKLELNINSDGKYICTQIEYDDAKKLAHGILSMLPPKVPKG